MPAHARNFFATRSQFCCGIIQKVEMKSTFPQLTMQHNCIPGHTGNIYCNFLRKKNCASCATKLPRRVVGLIKYIAPVWVWLALNYTKNWVEAKTRENSRRLARGSFPEPKISLNIFNERTIVIRRRSIPISELAKRYFWSSNKSAILIFFEAW